MTDKDPFAHLTPPNADDEDIHVTLMKQTAVISWRELQRFFAAGKVIEVARGVDLVNVGLALVEDNAAAIKEGIDKEQVQIIPDTTAAQFVVTDASVWALAVAPWVLVQQVEPNTNG